MATTYNTLGQVVINGRTHWEQLALQEKRRQEQLAYITLNNIYLLVEAGKVPLTIATANTLRSLVSKAYPEVGSYDSRLRDWWQGELEKLPGWLNV